MASSTTALVTSSVTKTFVNDKDPIGLHIGNVNRPLTKVLVTLDVTKAVDDQQVIVQ